MKQNESKTGRVTSEHGWQGWHLSVEHLGRTLVSHGNVTRGTRTSRTVCDTRKAQHDSNRTHSPPGQTANAHIYTDVHRRPNRNTENTHVHTRTRTCTCTCRHTHTRIQSFYGSLDFVRTTRVSRYQKKHSPTHTYRGHQYHPLSASSICYNPWHPPCSIINKWQKGNAKNKCYSGKDDNSTTVNAF